MDSRTELEMNAELIEALNRISDGIEEHSKIMSKVAHVLGFKLTDIRDTLESIRSKEWEHHGM